MRSLGLLLLRVVVGGLLAGHGIQKLYGKLGGHGPEGTGQYFESLGIHPAPEWARTAGAAELGGGSLTALGLLWPIGPVLTMAPMIVALRKAHWGKPIWVTHGGGELPVTNLAVAGGLVLVGPGAISLDRLLGARTPWWLVAVGVAGTAVGTVLALSPEIAQAGREARAELEREAAGIAEERAEAPDLQPEEVPTA